MNKVDILIEGYAKVTGTGWLASSTVSLIHANGIIILVDPGANKKLLLERLKEKNLTPQDIDFVFLTHLHLDHSLLMGIFPNAKVINHEAITEGDKGELVPALIPGTDISIVKTSGHEYAGASLLVPTPNGTVAVAGDVFWFEEGEKQTLDIEKKDDFATDMGELVKSRKEILGLADWVIPGHGSIIQVKK